MRFIVSSDIHFWNETECRLDKQNDPILASALIPKPDFAVITGDVTDTAMDGRLNCWIFPIFIPGVPKQLQGFEARYVGEFERRGIKTYVSSGNHDIMNSTSFWRRDPVLAWIRKRHGGLFYSIPNPDGVYMATLGMYPDAPTRAWLGSELSRLAPNTPIILFWHFNISGELSDWWSPADKEAMLQLLAPYNIIGVFVGHLHTTYRHTWGTNQIPVYSSSGSAICVCDYDPVLHTLTVSDVPSE